MESVLKVTGGEVNDIGSAEVIANTISSIVGKPGESDGPSSVGVQMAQKATQAAEVIVYRDIELAFQP